MEGERGIFHQRKMENNESFIKNDPELQVKMQNKLKKIEGQVRGVHKMIREYRSCSDVITQLNAIKSAINRVGYDVMACHLVEQLEQDKQNGKDYKDSMDDFIDILKKFS